MIKGRRFSPLICRGHLDRGQDEYMLMLRTDDWKLRQKTEVFRSLVNETYGFPPFQHITLYGPFLTKRGEKPDGVYNAIESASARISGISFNLSGYLRLRSRRGQAITHGVVPSDELVRFHETIWHSLTCIAPSLSWIDRDPKLRRFHITHGYNLRTRDADLICNTVKMSDQKMRGIPSGPGGNNPGNSPVREELSVISPDYAPLTSLRVIVLKNRVIEREYDLPAREWLNRQLAFNRNRTAVSLMQYRKLSGLELISRPEPLGKPPFVLSDLHLGHNNIIRYCRRPFNNAGEMDRVLIGNWNRTIGASDEVIYLGDLRYGNEAPPASEYLDHLNGRITFIQGNHDTGIPGAVPSLQIGYQGEEFLFIHNPDDAPAGFTGWIVHGHYHNNDLKRFPFINFGDRRVNVSCELTRYRPVSLETLHTMIREYAGHDNLGSVPDRRSAVIKPDLAPVPGP